MHLNDSVDSDRDRSGVLEQPNLTVDKPISQGRQGKPVVLKEAHTQMSSLLERYDGAHHTLALTDPFLFRWGLYSVQASVTLSVVHARSIVSTRQGTVPRRIPPLLNKEKHNIFLRRERPRGKTF